MKKVGRVNPTAAPNACDATAIVSAVTLSFAPNQVLANFAGALHKNGCPIAHSTCPNIQI